MTQHDPGRTTTPSTDAPFDAPFDAPWQPDLFALTVALSEAGVFSWSDWTQALGAELARGTPYWPAWLAAFERLMDQLGHTAAAERVALAGRWRAAARATPHGAPIVLANAGDAP